MPYHSQSSVSAFLAKHAIIQIFLFSSNGSLADVLDYAAAGLNQKLGLSNELFVLGDSLVLTVLGQVSFMPILVLAARLCPEVNPSSPYCYPPCPIAESMWLRLFYPHFMRSLGAQLICSS